VSQHTGISLDTTTAIHIANSVRYYADWDQTGNEIHNSLQLHHGKAWCIFTQIRLRRNYKQIIAFKICLFTATRYINHVSLTTLV
jgi:hypothetical protein